MAKIQFSLTGTPEEVIPDIRMTRAKDGTNGTATFYFDNPQILSEGKMEDITGMYLIDEEGALSTREVNGKFVNGQPAAIEAVYPIKSVDEWDRFMRFMQRYGEENGLAFSKS
ncbi:MAG: photosystem II reaction center protein Psb28 [Cyanobacteria bacterium P01_A01_bin.135]